MARQAPSQRLRRLRGWPSLRRLRGRLCRSRKDSPFQVGLPQRFPQMPSATSQRNPNDRRHRQAEDARSAVNEAVPREGLRVARMTVSRREAADVQTAANATAATPGGGGGLGVDAGTIGDPVAAMAAMAATAAMVAMVAMVL